MNQINPISILKSKQILLLGILLFLLSSAFSPKQPATLRVKQTGKTLFLSFPKLQNRSAIKVIDLQGNLVKGELVDEQLTQYVIRLNNYRSGMHQVSVENRIQRFTAKVILY